MGLEMSSTISKITVSCEKSKESNDEHKLNFGCAMNIMICELKTFFPSLPQKGTRAGKTMSKRKPEPKLSP